jgi:hypothetical protein
MKKLVFGIIIVLFTASCGGNKNNSEKSKADSIKMKAQVTQPPPPPGFTLNGVEQTKATRMIENFKKDLPADLNTAKAVSVWYNINDIRYMNNLIIAEKKKMDGVRIYFGCDDPAAGTGAKITPVIFLVSTKQRDPTVSGISDHEDYYDHISNVLPVGSELGELPNYDGGDAYTKGALLYGPKIPDTVICNAPKSYHYVSVLDAYNAVKRHRGNTQTDDLTAYNTRAEWFDLCFINSTFNAILNPHNGLNGLRIYFGKGIKGPNRTDPDVFILVPTKNGGGYPTDTYKCLEDLESFACTYDWTSAFTGNKDHDAKISFLKVAGYDKGELCPFSCNTP